MGLSEQEPASETEQGNTPNTRQQHQLGGMFCRSVPGDSSLTRYLGGFTHTPPTATPRALAERPSAALALFGSQVNTLSTNC